VGLERKLWGDRRLQRKALLLATVLGGLMVGSLGRLDASLRLPLKAERIPAKLVAEVDKIWQDARLGVQKTVPAIFATRRGDLARGLKCHTLVRGHRGRKQIALTFDDGPHPAYTPQLLAILKQYHAQATFFVVGELAQKNPELIKAEIEDGHCVANHTYHHVNLTQIPGDYVATEIKACGEVLRQITGRPPRFFRPPGGDYDREVAEISEALGYTMVLWTNDPGDYANPGKDRIKSRVLRKLGNGGIILLHDGIQQTIDVLPDILKYLDKKGYDVVTIDEMIRERGRATET
jgi:peptidoglycan-N-acetylglucosamine deacetylase